MRHIDQIKIRGVFLAAAGLCSVVSPALAGHAPKGPSGTYASGLTQSEIEEQRVVGRWLHPISGIFLIKKYTTGYVLIVEPGTSKPWWVKLREHPSKRGLRLDAVDSDTGDRFIILPDGRLVTGDREGDVMALEPAKGATIDARAEELAQLRADTACNADIDCVAEHNVVVDTALCKDAIQRKARWDYEWTGSALIFSAWHFNPKHPSKAGFVDYYGDAVRFQNGFGAWMNVAYLCTVDTKKNIVVKVLISPGHLQN